MLLLHEPKITILEETAQVMGKETDSNQGARLSCFEKLIASTTQNGNGDVAEKLLKDATQNAQQRMSVGQQ